MKFRFLGANRQVTGSRHYLEVGGARLLVDCGMYQERGFSDRNWRPSPVPLDKIDAVVMESTYGDRDHRIDGGVEDQLADVINRTVARGGNVVIPTFAVERAQELLYYLGQLIRQKRIDPIDVFLSSPMAIDVTKIFRRHRECFDDEAWEIIGEGNAPLRFPGLKLAPTVGESKAIHKRKQPAIVMATSGMCTAGRIKHHLRHNIARAESTILFVGFQAPGTLGRKILDGNSEVRIHGRSLPVRAEIERIEGFSGHADQAALLRWLRAFRKPPSQLFLVHGEEQGSLALADQIRDELGWKVSVPEYLDTVEL